MTIRVALLVALSSLAIVPPPLAYAKSDIERRPARPGSAGPFTTFVLRYDSAGSSSVGGDELYLHGPRGTPCRGQIAHEPTGHFEGLQRIRFGFHPPAKDQGDREYYVVPDFLDRGRWCRGYYHGHVLFQDESSGMSTHTFLRFFFVVR